MTLSWGPQSLPHTQRLTIAHEIAERVKERFHPEVLAIGLYGSLAREEDGPYSDIEMGFANWDRSSSRGTSVMGSSWEQRVSVFGKGSTSGRRIMDIRSSRLSTFHFRREASTG